MKILASLILSASLISCGTTEPLPDFPCPNRPVLLEVPEHIEVSPEVQDIVTENYLRLVEYAKKLETRADCKRHSED